MRAKSSPFAFQWLDHLLLVRAVPTGRSISSSLVKPISARICAHFLGDEEEEVDDVLGRPLKRLRSTGSCVATPTGQVLRWHLRIMMQPAAISGAGREAELVGAEQRADDDVAAGPQAAIDLQRDARAQPVQHQRLVRLGKADLPRAAGMLDRGQRRSAGAAFIAGDGDVVGARLGDAGRDRADADFRDQLDRHHRPAGLTFFRS